MAIAKKPAVRDRADVFIAKAPDAGARSAGGRVYKAKKIPVTFTVEADLLATFDARAAEGGLSRAALLALAMGRIVRGEL